jgi:hypothetical protein
MSSLGFQAGGCRLMALNRLAAMSDIKSVIGG